MPLVTMTAGVSPLSLGVLCIYAAACAVSPFGRCWHCRGFGFKIRQSRFTGRLRRGRDCHWCHGTGLRLRLGRRLYNFLADIGRDIR